VTIAPLSLPACRPDQCSTEPTKLQRFQQRGAKVWTRQRSTAQEKHAAGHDGVPRRLLLPLRRPTKIFANLTSSRAKLADQDCGRG
jgi:hypothetical protein